jgi:hypothetical protein
LNEFDVRPVPLPADLGLREIDGLDWCWIQGTSWSYLWCKRLRGCLLCGEHLEASPWLWLRGPREISWKTPAVSRRSKHFKTLAKWGHSSYPI